MYLTTSMALRQILAFKRECQINITLSSTQIVAINMIHILPTGLKATFAADITFYRERIECHAASFNVCLVHTLVSRM